MVMKISLTNDLHHINFGFMSRKLLRKITRVAA